MRFISVLATALIFATPAFAQQASSTSSAPAQTTATADQPPAHPATRAQVHEILVLTGSDKLKNQVMRGMMGYLQRSFPPYMPKDVIDDLESNMENIDMESVAVTAYQKHVSTEDAEQLIAFYKSPAGQRLASVLPAITQEMQLNAARQGMTVAQQVIEKHRDEINAAAAKYQQEHSDTPKVTSPN